MPPQDKTQTPKASEGGARDKLHFEEVSGTLSLVLAILYSSSIGTMRTLLSVFDYVECPCGCGCAQSRKMTPPTTVETVLVG